MVMPMPLREFKARLEAYNRGTHIQFAFDELDEDQREFLITGITPEEWADTSGEEELGETLQ